MEEDLDILAEIVIRVVYLTSEELVGTKILKKLNIPPTLLYTFATNKTIGDLKRKIRGEYDIQFKDSIIYNCRVLSDEESKPDLTS